MADLSCSKRLAEGINLSNQHSSSQCYDPTRIPNVGDDIIFRWMFQNKTVWSKATVISSSQNHRPTVIGNGTVLYVSINVYDNDLCDV